MSLTHNLSVGNAAEGLDVLARINRGDQAPMRSPRAQLVASTLGELGVNKVTYEILGSTPVVEFESEVSDGTVGIVWTHHYNKMLEQITTASPKEGN